MGPQESEAADAPRTPRPARRHRGQAQSPPHARQELDTPVGPLAESASGKAGFPAGAGEAEWGEGAAALAPPGLVTQGARSRRELPGLGPAGVCLSLSPPHTPPLQAVPGELLGACKPAWQREGQELRRVGAGAGGEAPHSLHLSPPPPGGGAAGDSEEAAPWISLCLQLGLSRAPGSWGQSRHKSQVHGAGWQPAPPHPWPLLAGPGGPRRASGRGQRPTPWGLQCPPVVGSGPARRPALCGLSQGSPHPPSPSPLHRFPRGEPVAWASPKTGLTSKLAFPFCLCLGDMGPEGGVAAEEVRPSGAPLARGGTRPPLQSSGCVACSSVGCGAWVCASRRLGPPHSCIVGPQRASECVPASGA